VGPEISTLIRYRAVALDVTPPFVHVPLQKAHGGRLESGIED
jgi:hypothetical protein